MDGSQQQRDRDKPVWLRNLIDGSQQPRERDEPGTFYIQDYFSHSLEMQVVKILHLWG